ncbi:MAG: tail fiber domain-containing protein, partial [SAR324 cluster bacterium]|nr:tail fiber domain-containing protein [SAR324 cluster bacterium]
AAQGGGTAEERAKSISELASFSTEFLENAKATLRSSEQYQTIFDNVSKTLLGIKDSVSNDLDALQSSNIPGMFDSLETAVSDKGPQISEEQKNWLKKIHEVSVLLLSGMTEVVILIAAFGDGFASAYKSLSLSLSSAYKSALKSLTSGFHSVAGSLSAVYHGIIGLPSKIGPNFVAAINGTKDAIVRAIKDLSGGGGSGIGGLSKSHWSGLSDARLKNNIQRGEEFYPGLQRASWTWNDKANALGLYGDSKGVIAQDLEKVLPQHIREFAGFKAVDYEGLKNTTGFKDGGVSSGSDAGHWELLHGTEAVVPLPQGRSIPVEFKSNGDNKDLQKTLAQILKTLESSADIQRNISHKSGQVVVVNSDGKKIAEETTARQGRSNLEL